VAVFYFNEAVLARWRIEDEFADVHGRVRIEFLRDNEGVPVGGVGILGREGRGEK
jgi:hypothetical protein